MQQYMIGMQCLEKLLHMRGTQFCTVLRCLMLAWLWLTAGATWSRQAFSEQASPVQPAAGTVAAVTQVTHKWDHGSAASMLCITTCAC